MRLRPSCLAGAAALSVVGIVAVVLMRTVRAGEAPARSPLAYEVPKTRDDSAIGRLSASLRFPTISFDDQSEPAALQAFREWLVSAYPAFHSGTRRTIVGGATLIYEWQGKDTSLSPIVLMAHQDVVPIADPERWQHPPFSGAIVNGAVWGRGALDCKSSLIAMLEAAESLLSIGHAPDRTIYFVFGHDEESIGDGARAAAVWFAQRQINAAFVLDEGGLSIEKNPITGRPATLVGIAEKGNLSLRLTAKAAGGHSNAPPDETAVDAIAKAIIAIRSRPFPARYDGVTKTMLEAMAHDAPFATRMAITNSWLFESVLISRLSAAPAAAATLRTTIAPTMLSGSPKQNVLPSRATATINFRLLPGDSIEEVIAHVRSSLRALSITVEPMNPTSEPSAIASVDSSGYRLIAGLSQSMFEGPVAPLLVTGLTDSRSLRDVAENIYRYTPIEFLDEDLPLIHGIDERIRIEDFTRMIEFYQHFLVGGGATQLP